jgi:hypothetical protein
MARTTRKIQAPTSSFDLEFVLRTVYEHKGSATARELSRALGVSTATLSGWMREHPEVEAAVREVRSFADDAVESALFKRAIGYELDVVEKTETTTAKGTFSSTKTRVDHIPPDVGAAKFWLANRRRGKWADRKVVEVEASLTAILDHVAEVLDLDPSEWGEADAAE